MASLEINNKIILTDLILEWGKTNILTPKFNSYLKELEDNFELLKNKQKPDLTRIISEITSELRVEVKSAIDKLSDPEIIVASDEDDLLYDVEEYFHSFDKVNFLKESLYKLLSDNDLNNIKETLKILNNIEDKIITWIHYSEISPLRLTVLNEIRNAYLKEIPEEKKYEFPWYDTFSEYSENTINTIIENFNIFLEMKGEKEIDEAMIPDEIHKHINEIYFELKRDKNLMSMIHREYVIHKSLLSVVNKRNALRLLHLAEDIAMEYEVTEKVEKVGLVSVAKGIIENYIKEFSSEKSINEAEKLYVWFIGAICSPQLEDDKRLDLLERVEARINEININDIAGKPREILYLLQTWYKGDMNVSDQMLVDSSFRYWVDIMNLKAQSMKEMEHDENPSALWDTLNELSIPEDVGETTEEDGDTYLEKIKSFIDDLGEMLAPQPSFEVASVELLGEEDAGRIKIRTNKNPINLSILPNQVDEYSLLTSPNHPENLIHECNAMEEYRNLWLAVGRADDLYWGGCLITIDGKIERVGEEMIRESIFHTVTKHGYQGAVIGISNDTEQLKKFIETIREMKNVTEELSLDNVIVLTFNFKTRKEK